MCTCVLNGPILSGSPAPFSPSHRLLGLTGRSCFLTVNEEDTCFSFYCIGVFPGCHCQQHTSWPHTGEPCYSLVHSLFNRFDRNAHFPGLCKNLYKAIFIKLLVQDNYLPFFMLATISSLFSDISRQQNMILGSAANLSLHISLVFPVFVLSIL